MKQRKEPMMPKKSKRSSLDWLFKPLEEIGEYRELSAALGGREIVCSAYGLDDTQRLHMVAGLARDTGRTLLFVAPNDQAAARAVDDLSALLDGRVALLPAREVSFQRVAAASQEVTFRRIEALGAAVSGELDALVAPVDALLYRLMPRERFMSGIIDIAAGDRMEPADLAAKLVLNGYERVDMVENHGQCAVRGGILDVYPVGRANALRVEFFDDEVDSLRDFDVMSQRSVDRVDSARLLPATEALLTGQEAVEASWRIEDSMKGAISLMGGVKANRQKQLESEYGLLPWEEFEKDVFDEDELPELELIGKPREMKPTEITDLERHFAPIIDSLRSAGYVSMAGALMPYLYERCDFITDYLPGALMILDQPDRLRERCENRTLEYQEQYKIALERENALPEQAGLMAEYDELLIRLTSGLALTLSPFMRTMDDIRPAALFKFGGVGAMGYHGNLKDAARDIIRMKAEGWRVALLAGGYARGERLKESLNGFDCPVAFAEHGIAQIAPGEAVVLPYGLTKGFQYDGIKLCVLTEADLYGVGRQKNRSRWRAGEKLSVFTDLSVGDYVVHEQYGVGQYMGTAKRLI